MARPTTAPERETRHTRYRELAKVRKGEWCIHGDAIHPDSVCIACFDDHGEPTLVGMDEYELAPPPQVNEEALDALAPWPAARPESEMGGAALTPAAGSTPGLAPSTSEEAPAPTADLVASAIDGGMEARSRGVGTSSEVTDPGSTPGLAPTSPDGPGAPEAGELSTPDSGGPPKFRPPLPGRLRSSRVERMVAAALEADASAAEYNRDLLYRWLYAARNVKRRSAIKLLEAAIAQIEDAKKHAPSVDPELDPLPSDGSLPADAGTSTVSAEEGMPDSAPPAAPAQPSVETTSTAPPAAVNPATPPADGTTSAGEATNNADPVDGDVSDRDGAGEHLPSTGSAPDTREPDGDRANVTTPSSGSPTYHNRICPQCQRDVYSVRPHGPCGFCIEKAERATTNTHEGSGNPPGEGPGRTPALGPDPSLLKAPPERETEAPPAPLDATCPSGGATFLEELQIAAADPGCIAPPVTIRCSALPLYETCIGAAFGGVYIDSDSGAARVGTAVHAVAAAIVRGGKVSVLSEERAHEVQTACDEAGTTELEEVRRLSASVARAWRALAPGYPSPKVETSMRADLPGVDTALTGTADLVAVRHHCRGAHILDWKTGRLQGGHLAQLKGYAWLTAQTHNLLAVTARVVWVRFGRTSRLYNWTRDELEEWAARLGRRLAKWDGRYRHGGHCAHCTRAATCPARAALVRSDVAALEGDEMAALIDEGLRDLAPDQVLDLRARAKQVKGLATAVLSAISELVRRHGPVKGERSTLEAHEEKRNAVDVRKAWPILRSRFDDDALAGILKVANGKLSTAARSAAEKGQKAKAASALWRELEEAGSVYTTRIKKVREVRNDG